MRLDRETEPPVIMRMQTATEYVIMTEVPATIQTRTATEYATTMELPVTTQMQTMTGYVIPAAQTAQEEPDTAATMWMQTAMAFVTTMQKEPVRAIAEDAEMVLGEHTTDNS